MDRITAAQVLYCHYRTAQHEQSCGYAGMSRAMVTRHLAEMENWAGGGVAEPDNLQSDADLRR